MRLPRTSALLASIRRVFPLTTRGVLVLTGALGTFVWFGQPAHDLIVTVLALALLALTVLCVAGTLLHAVWLDVWRRRTRFTARRGVATEYLDAPFSPPSLWFLPFHELAIDAPGGFVFQKRKHWGMRSAQRGEWSELDLQLSSRDVFGLSAITQQLVSKASLHLEPFEGRMERAEPVMGFALGDEFAHPRGSFEGDRVDVRAYAPGDSARFIHWKMFARSQKLATRQRERSVAWAKRQALYLLADGDDEASAALASVFLARMPPGAEWIFSTLGMSAPTSDLRVANDAIRASQNHKLESSAVRVAHLASFLDQLAVEPTTLLVFAPETPQSQRAMQVCLDLLQQHAEQNRQRDALHIWVGADAELANAYLGTLKKTSARVTVIERASGNKLA